MSALLHKITPLYAVCVIGIIYLLIQFFTSGRDYNIFAYLIIFIIFLAIGIAADRFLVNHIAYKKLFIGESILLVIAIVWYSYSSGYTAINIETTKPYFFVLYSNEGLKKKDIPAKGLFSKSIVIKSDETIELNYELYNSAQVNPPESWNYSFSSLGIDSSINGAKAILQIYDRENKMTVDEKNELLKKEIERIMK